MGRRTVSIGAGGRTAEPGPPGEPRRPRRKWKLTLAALVSVFLLLAVYDLASSSGEIAATTAASASGSASPTGSPAGTSSPSAQRTTEGSSTASRTLTVASVAAFGPDGTSDGDNPSLAYRIVDLNTAEPWYSEWYATPQFGGLQPGTGILLDMGKAVTVTSVQLMLGTTPGTDFQVRVGDTETLAGLAPVASASDAGGAVRLPVTARASGRYVLVWFTRLPPYAPGKYQVSVYGITVDGTTGA